MSDTGEGFARWINVERLGREPLKINIVASDEECREIAERLQIPAIHSLQMSGTVERKAGSGQIQLTASVKADAEQSCIISLAPVRQEIEEAFTMCYTFDREDTLVEDLDYVVSLEEEDLPELIEDGRIDLVQAMSEQVALVLEPYPRAEGSENSPVSDTIRDLEKEADEVDEETHKPFAGLKDLMKKN